MSKFQCVKCEKIFNSKKGYNIHYKKIHKKKKNLNIEKKQDLIIEKKQDLIIEKKQDLIIEKKQDLIIEKKQDLKLDIIDKEEEEINKIIDKFKIEEKEDENILKNEIIIDEIEEENIDEVKRKYDEETVKLMKEDISIPLYIKNNKELLAKSLNDLYIQSSSIVEILINTSVPKNFQIQNFNKNMELKREHTYKIWVRYIEININKPNNFYKFLTKYIKNPEYELLGVYILNLCYSIKYFKKSIINIDKIEKEFKKKKEIKIDKKEIKTKKNLHPLFNL